MARKETYSREELEVLSEVMALNGRSLGCKVQVWRSKKTGFVRFRHDTGEVVYEIVTGGEGKAHRRKVR